MAQRVKFEQILETIPILRSMDQYERAALADAFVEEVFEAGVPIIIEGAAGHVFYILLEGDALATQTDASGASVEVKRYAPGEYFGELALLRNDPRAASVTGLTECKPCRCSR